MNKSAFAGRDADAQKRLMAAAETIAAKFDDEQVNGALEAMKTVTHRDPQLKALFEREALAAFLEAVAGTGGEPEQDATDEADEASEGERLTDEPHEPEGDEGDDKPKSRKAKPSAKKHK